MKQNNRNNRNNGGCYNPNDESSVKLIQVPLSEHYKDKSKLYLPDGIAHKKAKEFQRIKIKSHQLRKILNKSKICRTELETKNFTEVRNSLFSILPLAAYNAGRDKSLKCLFNFLREHLNEKSIKSEKDIILFDELFTSIVAYHKFEEENKDVENIQSDF